MNHDQGGEPARWGRKLASMTCLAAILILALETRARQRLEPLEPWGEAFAGEPLVRGLEGRGPAGLLTIHSAQEARFVAGTQDTLMRIADHLNRLRQIASETLLSRPTGERAPQQRFQEALATMTSFVLRAEVLGCRPFAHKDALALQNAAGEWCVLDLSGFGALESRLGPSPLSDQHQVETTLRLLDQVYYRLVATYRELSGLLPSA